MRPGAYLNTIQPPRNNRMKYLLAYLGFFKYVWLLPIIILTGCVNAPQLPKIDTIVSVKFIENGFIANSLKYSYKFSRTPEENKEYRTFYKRFKQVVSGMKINFNVERDNVEATYLVIFDKHRLSSQQYAVLVNEYRARQVDSDHLGIWFYAKGKWSLSQTDYLEASEQLERPVPVSINETLYLSTLGEIALIPLMPILIFGLKP